MSDIQAEVRVRFAPSPTGYLHMGGARTALFNWLFARKMGGKFILRIEDTDTERSSEAMVRGILEGMEWLGLYYDEGPFFQSNYADQHRAAAYQLLESGWAYRDFTPKQERDDATIKQDIAKEKVVNPFRDLPKADSDARAETGEPFVIRFKVPEAGKTQFDDIVFGLQERDYNDIEDLVLLRSDGHPLYNLSVTVDDIEMGITHVVRGQDHINNTHKQVLLYQALGKPVPKFAHLPLILAPNKGKLSKRKHGEIVSVMTYPDKGIIPDAFINFLALLGWSPAGIEGMEGQELFLLLGCEALINLFSLEGIHKSNAVFNFTEGDARNWTDQKLLWMNAEYIKTWGKWHPFFPDVQDSSTYQQVRNEQINTYRKKFFPLVKAELANTGLWRDEYEGDKEQWFCQIISLLSERARTLKDFSAHGRAYFVDGLDFEFDEAAVKKNLQKDLVLKTLLPELADTFVALTDFTPNGIASALRGFAEAKGVKINLLTNATRTALTGQSVGPSLFELISAIGQKRAVERLNHAAGLV